jgi:hypothetical protein
VSVQEIIVLVGALCLTVSTVLLVRRRMLSVRYGLGWLTVSLFGIVAAPLLGLVTSAGRHLGFTPTGFALGLLIAFLGLICLQLSISLSGHHRAIQDLSEHAALVEHRLAELEAESQRDGSDSELPARGVGGHT